MHPQDMLSMKFLQENITRVKAENECYNNIYNIIIMSTILVSDLFTHYTRIITNIWKNFFLIQIYFSFITILIITIEKLIVNMHVSTTKPHG